MPASEVSIAGGPAASAASRGDGAYDDNTPLGARRAHQTTVQLVSRGGGQAEASDEPQTTVQLVSRGGGRAEASDEPETPVRLVSHGGGPAEASDEPQTTVQLVSRADRLMSQPSPRQRQTGVSAKPQTEAD